MYDKPTGLRKGYTTGSCAAAAAKAATMLLLDCRPNKVEIDTPLGEKLTLDIHDPYMDNGTAHCAVIKDGGDDPDITTGIKICAQASFVNSGIHIKGGVGVGKVTLPGLPAPVGFSAINPVPLKMIENEVRKVIPADKGVDIVIYVPEGEKIAKKTLNSKLGVIGGISILGTTGIVNPMSNKALMDSLKLELSVFHASGKKNGVFAFGNIGEEFLTEKLSLDKASIIKMSNFVGYMLDQAEEAGIERLLLSGHIGKLCKLAAGIFFTEGKTADARAEILTAYAALEGADKDTLEKIFSCVTTDAAIEIIDKQGLSGIHSRIVRNAQQRCLDRIKGNIDIGIICFDRTGRELARTDNVENIISYIERGL